MYLRTTQRRRKDGSLVRYLQLAHNRREGGVTRAEVLLNLGREDELDVEGLRRLARSIRRYSDPGREEGEPVEPAGGLEVVASRPLGGAWLLDALWRRLGVAEALRELLGARRFSTDVERVLFALVCNRALAPCSKLAAAEWASQDVTIPGLPAMDDDRAYRALELLVEADAEAKVQEAVFFACADLLKLEVDLLFFDTTSTYFETEPDDAEEGERAPFRALGHSKDHRPDLPQVVIGLAVTREGIPVRVWVWPGNTNDQTVIAQVKDDLRGWRLGRCVWVIDRGFSSDENLRYLTRGGGHWIAGERMRDGSPDAQAALARPGRYQTVRDNLRVKDVRLGQGDNVRRFVVCHNPAEAARDKAERDGQLARLDAELERIESGRRKARTAKARPPDPLALPAPDRERPAPGRPEQGRRRGTARRQVPALLVRPRPLGRGDRARLQEPARGRTLLPRPQDDARAAPRLPPARAPHPSARRRLLARAAADPDRRTRQRPELAADRDRAATPPPRHPARRGRLPPADHPADRRPASDPRRTRRRAAAPDHRPRASLIPPPSGPLA
jgi:hypothetical protein